MKSPLPCAIAPPDRDCSGVDPYEAFDAWCRANGFLDVAQCEPEDVDLERLGQAVEAYGKEA